MRIHNVTFFRNRSGFHIPCIRISFPLNLYTLVLGSSSLKLPVAVEIASLSRLETRKLFAKEEKESETMAPSTLSTGLIYNVTHADLSKNTRLPSEKKKKKKEKFPQDRGQREFRALIERFAGSWTTQVVRPEWATRVGSQSRAARLFRKRVVAINLCTRSANFVSKDRRGAVERAEEAVETRRGVNSHRWRHGVGGSARWDHHRDKRGSLGVSLSTMERAGCSFSSVARFFVPRDFHDVTFRHLLH